MEIATQRVSIPLQGAGEMGGYLAVPAGDGPFPAVLVFMEIFGVNSHIRDVVERVAKEGYIALAPDYFHRSAPGIELNYDDAGFAEGMKLLNQLQADEMISDAKAALTFLRGRSDVVGEKLGCMGFCIGGHMAYLTACETDVEATASFYGGGIAGDAGPGGAAPTLGRTSQIRGSLLALFAGEDPYIPQEETQQIEAALKEHRIEHSVVRYAGCDHGFFCDQRGSYDAKAAADAWERVRALFASRLAGRGD